MCAVSLSGFAHMFFPCLFQGHTLYALVFHLQNLFNFSECMEACEDGWLKNLLFSSFPLGKVYWCSLGKRNTALFSTSKIYDSSCLFKFTWSSWSSANPKFSGLKQSTSPGLFRPISREESFKAGILKVIFCFFI